MKKFIQYDSTTGEIKGVLKLSPRYSENIEGTVNGITCLESPDYSLSDDTLLNERYYNAGLRTRTASPGDYYKWTAAHEWEFDRGAFNSHVRSKRNNLLNASDWTQFADSPLSDADKAAWATYRQALRDLPANLSGNETSLDDVNWPTTP